MDPKSTLNGIVSDSEKPKPEKAGDKKDTQNPERRESNISVKPNKITAKNDALIAAAGILKNPPFQINKDLDDSMANALRIYDGMARQLMALLIVLGVVSVGCSLFVTAFAGSDWFTVNQVKVTSFFSTLSLTLITAFGLSSKGNTIRTAWRHLNKARWLYLTGHISEENYIQAYAEAETMLGGVDFSNPAIPGPKQSKEFQEAKNSKKVKEEAKSQQPKVEKNTK